MSYRLNVLHQIGLALSAYSHEWDDVFPAGAQGDWRAGLFPMYVSSKSTFLCPSNPVGWDAEADYWGPSYPKVTGDGPGRFPASYTIVGDPDNDGDLVRLYPSSSTSATIAVTESRFKSPQISLNFAPVGKPPYSHGSINSHNGFINCLFDDGHVRALKAVATVNPQFLWGEFSGRGLAQLSPRQITAQVAPEYR